MNSRTWVERFFFQFDYAKKVVFVIGTAVCAGIYLLFAMTPLQMFFINTLKDQLEGIKYQQVLNKMLKEGIQFQIFNSNELGFLLLTPVEILDMETKIDGLMNSIKDMNLKLKKTGSTNDILFQRLNEAFARLDFHWNDVKKELSETNLDISVANQWIDSIYLLIFIARDVFGLDLNFDRGNQNFLLIFDANLPKMEMLVFKLSQRLKVLKGLGRFPEEDFESLFILKRLRKCHEDFNDLLEGARKDLSFIRDNPLLSSSSEVFNECANYIEAYETTFNRLNFKKISSQELNTHENSAISCVFNIQEIVGTQLLSLFEKEIRILNIRLLISTILIIFAIWIVLMLYMTRVIRRPLADLKNAAMELANGNLSIRVKISSKDEVADMSIAFNQMSSFFEEVMLDAGEISTHLAQSSSNIFSTAKQLETSLFEQEESIDQIANNAKGISRTVQDFALSLQEVNNAATLTTHLATLSRKSLIEMETIMQQMANASSNIVSTLSSLKEKVGSINAIINTIIKIADQINLLSLNTAIRAGKKGLKHPGFSVIAEKIRELADQTAYATLDMEEVVQQIVSSVMEAVSEVENFSKKIQKQLEQAGEVREFLKKLISHTQTQISSFEIVNQGMQEQTTRAAQIHDAINKLTEAAERTTQSVRNLYLEIEYLYHASNNLHATTNTFTASSTPVTRSAHETPNTPLSLETPSSDLA